MIELHNLTKYFGARRAVASLSLRAGAGDVIGLLGPNGAGKTTAMRMIAGFLEPDAGHVRLCGYDMSDAPLKARRHLGYLPEGNPLYDEMTPLSFLRFIAAARGLDKSAAQGALRLVLERAGLETVAHQRIGTLSKGYRRRVGLAQAILHDPPILVLDEPTDGLDPNQKRRMRDLIRAMSPRKAILISTHLLEEVRESCTRILIMREGRVEADGAPFALLARSAYHDAVTCRLSASDGKKAEALLGGLAEVSETETVTRGGEMELTLFPASGVGGLALASATRRAAEAEALALSSLHIEEGRLEDLFRELTRERPISPPMTKDDGA